MPTLDHDQLTGFPMTLDTGHETLDTEPYATLDPYIQPIMGRDAVKYALDGARPQKHGNGNDHGIYLMSIPTRGGNVGEISLPRGCECSWLCWQVQ